MRDAVTSKTPKRLRSGLVASLRSRRGRRRWSAVLVVLLVLSLVGAAVHYLNAPAQGHQIAASDALATKMTPAKKTLPPASVQNSYFQLSTPPGYEVQANPPLPSGVLYDQTLIKGGDFGSLIVTIAIRDLPAGGLSADSSYQLRQDSPAHYKLSSQTLQGDTVSVASDTQSGSVVAFWPHGPYLATISVSSGADLSSGDSSSELATLQPLLNAWQWR